MKVRREGKKNQKEKIGKALGSPVVANMDSEPNLIFIRRSFIILSSSFFFNYGAYSETGVDINSLFSYSSQAMAARILANLIIMGSGIMARAFVQAYRQALTNASKNGVAQEAVQNIKRGKFMTESEARQILGVTEKSTWEEILQRYDNLFERNTKNGTFYLQSKVHRAKECLEAAHKQQQDMN